MKKRKEYNYERLDASSYNELLQRENDLTYQFGRQTSSGREQRGGIGSALGSGQDNGTTQTQGGSVATVALKTAGNATDIWIQNYIKSVNWKPKTIGFYIDGESGYAEFANIYVSGTMVVSSGTIGGFNIGKDYIRDSLNTMGMAATVTGGNDIRFWAGATFANRATAPFRVYEDGSITANDVTITGGSIEGASVGSQSGVGPPITTPVTVGQLYVDIDPNPVENRTYMSIGTVSDSDWLILLSTGITREIDTFDNITVTDIVTNIQVDVSTGSALFDNIIITEDIVLTII